MMKVEDKQLLYHNELEIYTPTECMIDCLCCGSILRLYVFIYCDRFLYAIACVLTLSIVI